MNSIVSSRPALAAALASILSPVLGPVRVIDPAAEPAAPPDLVIIDCVQNPRGFELIRQWAFAVPAVQVVALVGRPSDYLARKARQAGARLVFSEADDLAAWTMLLRRIDQIEFRAAPSFANAPRPLDQLTRRQLEVFEAIVWRGRTDDEIAAELGITVATAETHRSDVMAQLGVHRHEHLTTLAVRLGLIDPGEIPEPPPFRQTTRQHGACPLS